MDRFCFQDFIGFLRSLEERGISHFLEGGQAVNFWTEYMLSRSGNAQGLRDFLPFTSRDCDVWVDWEAMKSLKARDGDSIITSKSPADGQLGILVLEGEPQRLVDLMSGVFGIPPEDNRRLAERALKVNGIRVLDPLHLFLCKCHCLINLDQADRQDEKHLRMLARILPLYLGMLLDEAEAGSLEERSFLNEVKLLRKMTSRSVVRRALAKIGANAESLFPVARMKTSSLPKLSRFVSSTWGGTSY
jgi:hypothetical protein